MGRASAVVIQDGRRVPVAWPVSADWAGSPDLHIGVAQAAAPQAVATYDPTTGILTGLREGSIELSVSVNGVTRSAPVRVGG